MKIGTILYPRHNKDIRCIRLDKFDSSDGSYTISVFNNKSPFPVKSMIYEHYIHQFYTIVKPRRVSKYRLPKWF